MVRKLFPSVLITTLVVFLAVTGAFAAANKVPVVTTFDVAANSASPVPVLTFTATDSDGTVTGYLITETSAKPSASAAGWSATAPTQYVTTAVGTITLYAWAKDNANAVSTVLKSDTVAIPQPPINADTLDGKHASEFALAVHSHAISDVTGLNTALAGKADAGHNHDSLYAKKYARVIVVSADGQGDFTDPLSAMNSIQDASSSNPYLMKVMPGIYDIGFNNITVRDHVDIEGSGKEVTTITSWVNGSKPGTINWTDIRNSELRDITVEVYGQSLSNFMQAVDIIGMSTGSNLTFSNVKIIARVDESSFTIGVMLWGNNNNVVMRDVEIAVSSNNQGAFTLGVYASGANNVLTLRDVIIDASGIGVQRAGIQSNGTNNTITLIDSDITSSMDGISDAHLVTAPSIYKLYSSRIKAPMVLNLSNTESVVLATGSQLDGDVLLGGAAYKFVNCLDGAFNPIANQ